MTTNSSSNKRNNGFITTVTIADERFEIDGYVRKDVMESLLSWKALQALDWTNHLNDGAALVLSESCFIENKLGDTLEVEIEEINAYENRRFDGCLKLSKAIEKFIQNI